MHYRKCMHYENKSSTVVDKLINHRVYVSASDYTELSQITAPVTPALPSITEAAYVNSGMFN